MIRSQPPPQAGCPLGDPGPLPALTQMLIYQTQKSRRNPKRIWRGRIVRVGTRKESRKARRVASEEVGPNELKSMNSLPKLKTVLFRTLSNSTNGRRRTLSVTLNSRVTFKSKMN